MSSYTLPLTPPIEISRSPSPAPIFEGTLYFGYGSNLWHHQVELRFPAARFVGIARLRHWRWQINERGYANVVEAPKAEYDPSVARWLGPLMGDPEDDDLRHDNLRTYGMVYELNETDVKRMDEFEGAPHRYTKEEAFVELWHKKEINKGNKYNVLRRGKRVKVMFYADRTNTTDALSALRPEYSYRMNQGISDAIADGIPEGYINTCIRPFVPHVDDLGVKAAIQDAMRRGVDVKKLVESAENELALTSAVSGATGVMVDQESLQKYIQSFSPQTNGHVQHHEQPQGPSLEELSRRRALSSRW